MCKNDTNQSEMLISPVSMSSFLPIEIDQRAAPTKDELSNELSTTGQHQQHLVVEPFAPYVYQQNPPPLPRQQHERLDGRQARKHRAK